ncbi:MAG: protein-glutamate methylesterase/protein-glutamine glutaminase [Dehalococcoidales bacterium]
MQNKVRVLVVDDSGYVIAAVSKRLEADPGITIIGSARNGLEAIEKVKSLKPDVVTMDVVMPEMDGITALGKIMTECPTAVVMLSALTSENASITIHALELGAVDFYLKPSSIRPAGVDSIGDTLADKIKAAAASHLNGKRNLPECGESDAKRREPRNTAFDKLVVIGSSTGGPRALMEVIPALPADIPAAFLVVQHMPPVFTRALAERLAQVSQIEVVEAKEGDELRRGTALVAPGNFHMLVDANKKITLNQGPTVLGVRPSVNTTMYSAANAFGNSVLGVILTGMGTDGTEGASRIKRSGGKIIAQDEASSTIYGMPQSVAKAGYVDQILPLTKIAAGITDACMN